MRQSRAALRLLAILLWTGGWFLLWGTVTLVVLPFRAARIGWRQYAVQQWARGVAVIIGMGRVIAGSPPPAPFFLVTNHLSYLDILLLHSVVRGVFIAKHDMRRWPGLGFLAQLTGTIWINRASRRDAHRTLQSIGTAIDRGDGVIVFPEGTTSSGESLLPMKPALLEWAVEQRFPVHYAAIGYEVLDPKNPASPRKALCWADGTGFGGHAWGALQLRRFEARISFGAEPVTGGTRRELLERVREGILERFEPIRDASSR